MKSLKGIFASFLILFGIQMLIGQGNFIQLNDASGRPATQKQLDTLNFFADQLVATIDYELPTSGQFKVFDVGFYLHEKDYTGGIPEAFQRTIDAAAAQSPYYLVLGRQSDEEGINRKLWVEFKFPEDDFICIDNRNLSEVLTLIGTDRINSRYPIFENEKLLIQELQLRLEEGFCCSGYYAAGNKNGSQNRALTTCIDYAKIDSAVVILKDNSDFIDFLKMIVEIVDFYHGCDSENWEPKEPKGIVPKCLWENIPEYSEDPLLKLSMHTVLDPPFLAGQMDGSYATILGIKDLGVLIYSLPEFRQKFQNILYSFTIYYLICPDPATGKPRIHLNKLEYEEVIKKLNEESWSDAVKKAIFDEIYDWLNEETVSSINKGAEAAFSWLTDLDCPKMQKLNEATQATVKAIYQLIITKEVYETLWAAIKEKSAEFWDDIDGISNEERYYHGFYGSQVAYAIVPFTKADVLDDFAGYFNRFIQNINSTNGKYVDEVIAWINRYLAPILFNKFKKSATYKGFTPSMKRQFEADFGKDYKGLKFVLKGDNVKAWETLLSSPTLRTNGDNLTHVSNYLKKHPSTQGSVKTHFDQLAEPRKQPFVNALKYAGRDPISIPNARRANPSEISDAVNRITNHRGTKRGGNYGYVDGHLTGTSESAFTKIFRSGEVKVNESQIFEPVPATGTSGTWLRDTDSEFKMLNDLAKRLGGVKGGSKITSVEGSIKIVSENPYCASCAGVIQQFHNMFPKINLILVDGIK